MEFILSLLAGVVASLLAGAIAWLLGSSEARSKEELAAAGEKGKEGASALVGTFSGLIRGVLSAKEQWLSAAYNFALFLTMLGGVFANYFWTHGIGWPTDVNAFWKPVLISPIIFLLVYVAATKQPKGLIPVLVAFQNGFFWQTILQGAGPIR